MKLFYDVISTRTNTVFGYLLFVFLLQSCATKHSQFGSKLPSQITDDFDNPKTLSHTFYLIGDAGNSDEEKSKKILSVLENRLQKADTSSTLLFLGDNIYPNGIPKKGSSGRKLAEEKLNNQLKIAKKFKGKTIFIPGNHDWYSGIEGLEAQEKMVNDFFKSKNAFLPHQNCSIEEVNVNENVALIVIDSEWYLENWNAHPTINEDCEIKTRDQFFEELERAINRNQKKTTIIAMHHPLMSNGTDGGQFSLEKQLFPFESKIPLPIIGTGLNLLRKASGISPQDIHNKKYSTFVKRIETLIRDKRNIIVAAGHEHNLQYIENDNIKQVISGAGSREEAARTINKNDFSYGHNGYAMLQILKTGASKISFFGIDNKGNEALLFKNQPLAARQKPNVREFTNKFRTTKDTSIYTKKMTQKGAAYRFLWGSHYRKYYSTSIKVKVASLDTLYGGLKPVLEGDDHQFKSLLLTDKNGDEFEMRALKKSATRFLQSVAFKNQSVEKDFRDTYTENFIMDFYTTAHPYTPLVIGKLADRIDVNHTNPKLYYVPKQNTLGLFNENFGDELYLIEERPMNGFTNLQNFGKPPKIVGTEEVLVNLQADQKYEVDEKAYIRARLFDMLIGDWDRKEDQWRWGEFQEKEKVIYRPIPRDRDQAFSKYDGNLLSILMNIPAFRHMRSFTHNLKNVKWFNREAYNLDLAFITKSDEKVWLDQARYIAEHLSDTEIDEAFENLPKEVKDASIDKIKLQLKIRKKHLEKYASEYYSTLQQTVLIVGTEKKDKFIVSRANNATRVQVFQMNKTGEQLVDERIYQGPKTKELWIYGLGDEDIFEVRGNGHKKIKVRLLGGVDNDTYNIINGSKVRVYDFKSKKNTVNNEGDARIVLSDKYEVNTYDYKKPKYNVFAGYPLIGFNPDDGIKMGVVVNYNVNGFNRFPYSQRHSVRGNYYFATNGFELSYKGISPHFVGNWNLIFDALYTSPNFSANFFGFGNETPNYDAVKKLDYNRVKIRKIKAAPSLQWLGESGASVVVETSFERIEVDRTPGRYIAESGTINTDVFDYKNFADVNVKYVFENYDNNSNPTLGMTFSLLGGYKININEPEKKFPYAESTVGFTYRLVPDAQFVLATFFKGKALFEDHYEFYQAATVGGDLDLRGFRNQRFSGKQSFYQSTDIRWNLGKLQNGFAPIRYGVFTGFDYGRVWLKNETSDKWHQSFGGGIFFNGVNLLTAKVSYFQSSDGGRFSFGLGLGF
jgi:hypothetical protein